MGRKGSWLCAVKKVFGVASKETKFDGSKDAKPQSVAGGSSEVVNVTSDAKCMDGRDEEQTKYAYPGSTVIPAQRVANLFTGSHRSKEEMAAVKIQTAFRGYMSRRALRALKGLVRLKTLVQGPAVMRQTINTVQHMHTLTRVLSQIQSRRIRKLDTNRTQLTQKQAEELEMLQMRNEWDDSLKSKEQIETKLMSKQGAAVRRERALAYAFTHQTLKSSSKTSKPMFIPPGNLAWGWSWLDRWMSDRQPLHSHITNLTSTGRSLDIGHYPFPVPTPRPSSPNRNVWTRAASTLSRNSKSATARWSIGGPEYDSMSIQSSQTMKKHRRHSIPGSLSVKDVESLVSSCSVPRYMVATESAMAKSESPRVNRSNPFP